MQIKKSTYWLPVLGCMILCCSCKKAATLPPQQYVQYVQDPSNGLLVKQQYKGLNLSLQYQPTDYLVLMELRSLNISKQDYETQRERFKGLEHFNLHIDKKGMDSLLKSAASTASVANNGNASQSSVPNTQYASPSTEYLDFGIKQDLKLVEGKDTLTCAICERESDGGIYPFYSFTIGFPNKGYNGDRQFLYNGKKLGTGDIKLLVSASSINDMPALKVM